VLRPIAGDEVLLYHGAGSVEAANPAAPTKIASPIVAYGVVAYRGAAIGAAIDPASVVISSITNDGIITYRWARIPGAKNPAA